MTSGGLLDRAGAVGRVNQACRRAGSQAAFARGAGVSPQHLGLMLAGERQFTPAVLDRVGLVRVERYAARGDVNKSVDAAATAPAGADSA